MATEDLVLGMGTSSITPVPQRQNLILLNDGKGRFTLSSPSNLSRANNFTRTVIVADFDGNKTPDIFFGNDLHYYGQRDQLHFNDGKGMFINGAENAVPATGFVIQAGDLDGDGSPDLIYQPADFGSALFGGFPYELLLNDGNGRFSRVARSAAPFDSAAYAGFRFFDVDGDKDRDLMVFRSEKLSLFLNKGDGTFTDATNQVPSFTVQYPFGANFLLIDLEGDGDMDVLMLGVSTRSQVLVNDGKGRFKFDFSGRVPRAVGAIATDLDKDGDSDLVLTVKRLQFYMNDGKGLFTLQKGAFPADAIAFPLFAIDVDGDSDLDVLAGGSLFLNNGKNVFTDRTFGRLPKNMGGATFVGDVDLDGDIDAVANGKLFLNDGKGIFFDVSARRLPDGASVKVVTGVDVDRDGDIDLFGRTGFGPILLSNLHRQSRSPLLLWLGREHRLENFSRPGYASKHQFVLPFLALGAARLFVPPFGTFGLDLKTTVVGPVLRTNPGTGSAVLKLPIPMLQSLIGIDIASQALILDDVILAMRLTNTVVDRIRY